jgi:putative transposase
MSTYLQSHFHIVFSTKYRTPCLHKENRHLLFKYIHGVLKNNRCHVYRINGVDDHIHILTHLHPSVALAPLIKDIKLSSHSFIKQKQLFQGFKGWQKGYSAFTHHIREKERLIEYIKNQEAHHQRICWQKELKTLLDEHRVIFDEKYFL